MFKPLLLLVTFAAALNLMAEEGGTALFNGKDLAGWTNAGGKEPGKKWIAAEGELRLEGKGGGDLWTKERYGDFVLALEFQTTGNSGVFIRTDKPQDNVQTGIEVQVNTAGGPDKHSVGAIYDLVPPTANVAKDGTWNKLVITARGPQLTVVLNGTEVAKMNLDQWTTAGKNPDGSDNKFSTALKDFKREGHIGFQDHGHAVKYRHITLRRL